jgi:hypothetical protein
MKLIENVKDKVVDIIIMVIILLLSLTVQTKTIKGSAQIVGRGCSLSSSAPSLAVPCRFIKEFDMKEIWKDIKGFEKLYQISNIGNVKRLPRKSTNRHGDYILSERFLSLHVIPNGYKVVVITYNNKQYTKYIHRLIAESFIDNYENKKCVNHKDGNKLNNNISNLEWCTFQENVSHAIRIGLTPQRTSKGNPMRKLEEKQIKYIFELAEKYTNPELSEIFNVSIETISGILNNKIWGYLNYEKPTKRPKINQYM